MCTKKKADPVGLVPAKKERTWFFFSSLLRIRMYTYIHTYIYLHTCIYYVYTYIHVLLSTPNKWQPQNNAFLALFPKYLVTRMWFNIKFFIGVVTFSSILSNWINVYFGIFWSFPLMILFWIRNLKYSTFWKLLCDEDICSEYTGYDIDGIWWEERKMKNKEVWQRTTMVQPRQVFRISHQLWFFPLNM